MRQWLPGICSLLLPAAGLAQQPDIASIAPRAIPPGTVTEIRIAGKNLDALSDFWSTIPLEATPAGEKESRGVLLKIEAPADTPTAILGFRAASTHGASNLQLIMVDNLPTLAEQAKPTSRENAQKVSPPCAIEGTITEPASDVFAFAGEKGRWISVEAVAQRLGSRLDPSIRLLDERGREIAWSEDEAGIGHDAHLRVQLPESGTYFLEIHDGRYTKSGDHFYRLRIGDFPLQTTPFPLGLESGRETEISFPGEEQAGVRPQTTSPPASARRLPVDLRYSSRGGSGFAGVAVDPLPSILETEPNHDRDKATSVSLPAQLQGRFTTERDQDWFGFQAKKGERFLFRAQSRSLGSPAMLFLRLLNQNGKTLAEAGLDNPGEPELDFKAPSDGRYHLLAEELNWFAGPDFSYRILATPQGRKFALTTENDRFTAEPGGTFEVEVKIDRDKKYEDPIEIVLASAPEGFALDTRVIDKKKKSAKIKIRVPDTAEPGRLFHIRLAGQAKDEGQAVEVSTQPVLGKLWPELPFPPRELDGLLAVAIQQPTQPDPER